jgi:hypothetical protein
VTLAPAACGRGARRAARGVCIDVAAWIARHRAEFSDEAFASLRGWFTKFRAGLAAADWPLTPSPAGRGARRAFLMWRP